MRGIGEIGQVEADGMSVDPGYSLTLWTLLPGRCARSTQVAGPPSPGAHPTRFTEHRRSEIWPIFSL
jgi:hypothetical protein